MRSRLHHMDGSPTTSNILPLPCQNGENNSRRRSTEWCAELVNGTAYGRKCARQAAVVVRDCESYRCGVARLEGNVMVTQCSIRRRKASILFIVL